MSAVYRTKDRPRPPPLRPPPPSSPPSSPPILQDTCNFVVNLENKNQPILPQPPLFMPQKRRRESESYCYWGGDQSDSTHSEEEKVTVLSLNMILDQEEDPVWWNYGKRVYFLESKADSFISKLDEELRDLDLFLRISPTELEKRQKLQAEIAKNARQVWCYSSTEFRSFEDISLPNTDIHCLFVNVPSDDANLDHTEILNFYVSQMAERGIFVDYYISQEDHDKYTAIYRLQNFVAHVGSHRFTLLDVSVDSETPVFRIICRKTQIRCVLKVRLEFFTTTLPEDALALFCRVKLNEFPEIRPVVRYLKLLLEHHRIQESRTAVPSCDLLIIMILHVVTSIKRNNKINEGKILLKCLKYYGSEFDYETKAIDITKTSSVFSRPYQKQRTNICCLSPVFPYNPLGESTCWSSFRDTLKQANEIIKNSKDSGIPGSVLKRTLKVESSDMLHDHMQKLRQDGLY